MRVWNHAKLGRFVHEDDAWVGQIMSAAFKPFSYATLRPGKFELAFVTNSADEMPTRAMIAAAERVIANAQVLADDVVAALWDDINGRGPGSGIWWHGDFAFVAAKFEENIFGENLGYLTESDDLYRALGLKRITVRNDEGSEKPMVELSFAAAFEEEYGVGIATDGESIVGIGYIADVTPFEARTISRRAVARR